MSIELIGLILLGVVVLVLLAVAGLFGLGLYPGWFSIGSVGSAVKDNFRLTLEADRIEKD
jgi:hypothetical protein